MRNVINDITTSFEDPPQFKVIPQRHPRRDYSYPQRFVEIQKKLHPGIAPLHSDLGVSELVPLVLKALSAMGLEIVAFDEAHARVEAIATTALLRFKDDVVIEIRTTDKGSDVHMRSKSRLGRSDLGANAKRIQGFFHKLDDLIQDS